MQFDNLLKHMRLRCLSWKQDAIKHHHHYHHQPFRYPPSFTIISFN